MRPDTGKPVHPHLPVRTGRTPRVYAGRGPCPPRERSVADGRRGARSSRWRGVRATHAERVAAAPEASAREAVARRGAVAIFAEALGIYRRRARPLLALSLLTEGIVTLIALPYTITAGNQTLDLLRAALGAAQDPRAPRPRCRDC